MMKGLFRNGRRHTVARSNAGHAQASTATNESRPTAPRSIVVFELMFVPEAVIFIFGNRGQSSGD